MRHFLSVAVTHLAASMRTPSALMLLVSPPGFSLALPSSLPRARGTAVSSSSGVTEDAQQDATPAGERLADNDVQRDHGPRRRRRRARLPRRPVRTRMGRTATSRSRGAIEGSELESPRPRYLASRALYRSADAGRAALRPRCRSRSCFSKPLPVGHRYQRPHSRADALRRDRAFTRSRRPVLFAAICGDRLRRDQQDLL